jgi:glc operon protein GlcG
MAAAEAEAAANEWPMVIAIVDSTGHLLLFERMEQAQYASVQIAIAKAETALDARRPTKVFQDAIAAGGIGLRMATVPTLISLEGGIPLFAGGDVVGAIGVSGMQSTQDAQVAQAGAAVLG